MLPFYCQPFYFFFFFWNNLSSDVRLFTSTGELVCLQTKGFLEYNKATKKIESFLCINTVIRGEDQERYLNEQKEKFTPYISELQYSNLVKSPKNCALDIFYN